MRLVIAFVAGAVLGAVLVKKFKKDPFYPPQGWKLHIG